MTIGLTLLDARIAAFDQADDAAKREIASRLQPYLASDPEKLLNAKQKARQMGLHPETLVRMARAGRVPGATQAGREWRFLPSQTEIKPVRSTPLSLVSAVSTRRTPVGDQSTATLIGGARKRCG
jgi:hypothetical protein